MKCLQAEKLFEDYNDGELDPKRASELETHLASCTNCSHLLESLRRENKLYEDYGQSLEDSLEITPSMWDRIRSGAETETHVGRPFPERVFAGLGLIFSKTFSNVAISRQLILATILVVISVCGTLLVVHHKQRGAVTAGKEATKLAPGTPQRDLESALLAINKAEQEYIEAIRTLSGIVDKKRESIDPALAAELERNLKAMDEAIASSRKAYHAHPVDPELARHMLRAYQKKVELLQDLALRIT